MKYIVNETGRIRHWSFVVFEAIWTELPNLKSKCRDVSQATMAERNTDSSAAFSKVVTLSERSSSLTNVFSLCCQKMGALISLREISLAGNIGPKGFPGCT